MRGLVHQRRIGPSNIHPLDEIHVDGIHMLDDLVSEDVAGHMNDPPKPPT
jgi:hypothetical protein